MKRFKKFISLLLSIVMLLGITAGLDFSAQAASNPYSGGNSNCTWYAWQRTYEKLGVALPNWGNAKNWYSNAKSAGYSVSSTAKADYIVVYGASSVNSYGHVAYVESVSGSKMTISEGGYLGGYNKRSVSATGTLDSGTQYAAPLIGFINPIKISKVTVTFNGNGGTPSAKSLTLTKGETMGSNTPTATGMRGYVFEGWYTAASGGTRYNNGTKINSNVTLYAHWLKINDYSGGLKEGHIYRIICKKSNMALQSNGDKDGALITQQKIGDTGSNNQLWRVNISNGVAFQSMHGGRYIDVKGSSLANDAALQLYGTSHGNKDNRLFIPVSRGSGYYSIHAKHSNRAFDIAGASKTSAGAQVQQYYCNSFDQQLFKFEEITNRNVKFYDNLTDNYLPTPKDVFTYSGGSAPKECYISRNTDYLTTSIDSAQNKLIINSKKAGSASNSLTFRTTVNASYYYDMYDANTSTMYLYFTAKSNVDGAKMYFRWGYDPTTDCKYVTLDKTEKTYMIEMPRTLNSGENIHPWIDKACTIEMKNILLTTDKLTLDTNSPAKLIPDTSDTYGAQAKSYNINSNNGTFGTLPQPKTTKSGYVFDGWYTQRIGGTKITESSKINCNAMLYAHWKEAELTDISVFKMPEKQTYNIGDVLDTKGLQLKLTFSDGSEKTITSGFSVGDFDSSSAGAKTITVSYGGKTTSFNVTVKESVVEDNSPAIRIESKSASKGETVTVNVSVENNPGFSAASVKFVYDETRLELLDAKLSDEFASGANVSYDNLPYLTFVKSSDIDSDVTMLTLTFKILDDAPEGNANVSIEYFEGDISNEQEDNVNFKIIDGNISIVNHISGDINGDGRVNTKDLTRLLKYINHEDVEKNESALDVNGDGRVNTKDLTRLLKYINHENVEIH